MQKFRIASRLRPLPQIRRFFTSEANYTTNLDFQSTSKPFDVFQVLGDDGAIKPSANVDFSEKTAVHIMEKMLNLQVYDKTMYMAQGQGRITFYMTSTGEEATIVGSSAALDNEDMLFLQYREVGALITRGMAIQELIHTCFSNKHDPGKGRQMPLHYSSRKFNMQMLSSPLTTQMPHAVGAGYAFARTGAKRCSVTYFGEGAASEGDFAVSLNFAATLNSQTLFLCRNNGWAISTPSSEQYKGDGIAPRGTAYGIPTIRVDGNDAVAVYTATKEARERCIKEQRPYLVEFMTYRVGHHSTSDSYTLYRSEDEVQPWTQFSPVARLRTFMLKQGWWSEEREEYLKEEYRKEVMQCIHVAENEPYVAWESGMFNDVYDHRPWHLEEQKNKLKAFVAEYGNKYDLSKFEAN